MAEIAVCISSFEEISFAVCYHGDYVIVELINGEEEAVDVRREQNPK